MYRLYSARPASKKGTVLFPEFIYVRSGLQQEFRKILQWYRINKRIVPTQHLIVKLLNSINTVYGGDINNYARQVANETTRLTMLLGLTNDDTAGKVHHDVFFRNKSNEIILTNNEPFTLNNPEQDWMDLDPIKVLRHPNTDTCMPVFNGNLDDNYYKRNVTVDNNNFYVISINIPMLAVQYALWNKSLTANQFGKESTNNFVATYPIVNMIPSYLDYAIFNRFFNILTKKGNSEQRNVHPFMTINYYDRIDRVLKGLCEHLKTHRLDFANVLMSIPAVFQKDMFSVGFPSFSHYNATRQVLWALEIAVMPTIAMLLTLAAVSDEENDSTSYRYVNTHGYNFLRIAIRKIQSDNLLESHLEVPELLLVKRYLQNNIIDYLEN